VPVQTENGEDHDAQDAADGFVSPDEALKNVTQGDGEATIPANGAQ